MKRIEIIIPDGKLKDANEVIRDANTGGMSYYRIEGRGGIKAEYASGTHYIPEFIPRIKVEVVVKDQQVEELVGNLLDRLGDELGGKIFILDVHSAIDLNTRKRGEAVI
ncbi:MAG: P-II family nitrogen regulator [Thermoproteota archaeon]|nr:P-II family nitrogen regulator [Thermoproteota archaeon]